GIFHLAQRVTAGFRNYAVGVGAGFVLGGLIVFAGLDHVVECSAHLSGRQRLGDVHLAHGDAGAVVVEVALQTFVSFAGEYFTTIGDDGIHLAAANNVTDRGFGGLHQADFGIFDFEVVTAGVG